MLSIQLRPPLTNNHPHGYLLSRNDRALGYIPIAKNASTHTKILLACNQWVPFADFTGPCVALFRRPYQRFVSSIPETMARITHSKILNHRRGDNIVVVEEVYSEVMRIALLDIKDFCWAYLELVEYAFFDVHHEPQLSFVTDRKGKLRIDPISYLVEHYGIDIPTIEDRFGLPKTPVDRKLNASGAKAISGPTPLRDFVQRIARRGFYSATECGGPLLARYPTDRDKLLLRDIYQRCNKFAFELRSVDLGDAFRARVNALYEADLMLWQEINSLGRGRALSEYMTTSGRDEG